MSARSWTIPVTFCTVAGLAVLACDSEDGPNTAHAPTFYEDVAPIFKDNCLGCHVEGGIAPFELKTYEQVKPLGSLVMESVNNRTMPPFLPDASGSCAEYEDALWLSDKQLKTLNDWFEGGMKEGDASNAPKAPAAPPTLDDATHEAWMPVEYTPNAEVDDDYRCFVFDSDMEGDDPLYIEEYEVVPGDERVVHHLIVYQPDDEAALAQAKSMDEDEAGPGYTCYGGPGIDSRMLMNWAPGTPIVKHPEGTGVTVKPGIPFVVQVHYNLANGPLPDATRVKMKMAKKVEHPVSPWFFANFLLFIPPGEEAYATDNEQTADGVFQLVTGEPAPPMTIVGLRAHMHGLGRKMQVELIDGETGDATCLVDIPRYDFDWQRSYFLKDHVPLDPDDRLRVNCVYDTRDRDATTTWGEGTEDEMCLATFYTYDRE